MEQELRERIDAFNNEKVDLRNDIESFCSDQSVDLDIRWQLFVDSGLGETSSDYINFDDLGVDLYSDTSRYATVDLISEVENINAWVANYGDKPKDELSEYMQKYHGVYTSELVIKMKERLLDMFSKACIMDW